MPETASTYSLLTAQRILQNHQIELSQTSLLQAVTQMDNRLYPALQCSFDLIFSQLILDQAHTYLVVAQQNMVDILLNTQKNTAESDDEANSSEPSSGEEALLTLQALQKELQALNQQETDAGFFLHELVAETQQTIGELLKDTNETTERIQMALKPFLQRTQSEQKNISDLREKIRDWMIRMNQLILVLPDYKQDPSKREKQVEMLAMMSTIGYNPDPINPNHEVFHAVSEES